MLQKYIFALSINEKLLLSSYVRGIPLAEGKVSIKLKKNKYSVKVDAHSVGLFSVILDWHQTIRSFGKIENNRFISLRYLSQTHGQIVHDSSQHSMIYYPNFSSIFLHQIYD